MAGGQRIERASAATAVGRDNSIGARRVRSGQVGCFVAVLAAAAAAACSAAKARASAFAW